jgi:enoyl-CoA hydratase/carnithine racemase
MLDAGDIAEKRVRLAALRFSGQLPDDRGSAPPPNQRENNDNQASGQLLFEVVEDHIAVIRFNRPEARNAVNVEITEAMTAAVERTESDPNIRVVVLGSSTPGMFGAGADLKLVAAGRADDMRPGDGGFAGLVDATRAKPWIAAVEGPAMGGGFEIWLACDLIVAAEGSRFALPRSSVD